MKILKYVVGDASIIVKAIIIVIIIIKRIFLEIAMVIELIIR